MQADVVATGFLYADDPTQSTSVGAQLSSSNSRRRLTASNGFSGFISEFQLWFGMMTVPYVNDQMAKAACTNCSTCLTDGVCLPLAGLEEATVD